MGTKAIVFPFDLFGSGGTTAGAQLLGDSLREMIDDTNEETQPVRQKAFVNDLAVQDVELNTLETINNWRAIGQRAAEQALKSDFTLWLSGNHLGCLPIYDALAEETLIIQFDAHLDCYNLHDTHETLSHGNFLRHLEKPRTIINIGHRDLFLPAAEIRKHFAEAYSIEDLASNENKIFTALRKRIAKAKSVWIDIDVDVFDPSICPAVHSPTPCGLMGPQMLRIIHAIGFGKLRGISVSEFDPGRDRRDASLNLLGWLLEWLLLKKANA